MLILSAPVHYTLELYPLCNNRCRGCGNIAFDKGKPFSNEAWRGILEKIHPHAAHVRLSGGEPTLHPKFDAIVHTLSEMNIPFVLFTNGRWRHPAQILQLLKQIPQFRGMLISLHAHVPEIHDSFTRIKGSFAETVKNIRKAIEDGLPVAASAILMPSNIQFIREMVDFFETLGVCQTTFSRYVAVKNHDSDVGPDRLGMAIGFIEEIRAQGSNVEYSVCIPQCFKASSSLGCLSGVAYCIIDPWGNVRPCTHVPIICGNILTQSIEDIWHCAEMERWRQMVPKFCFNCVEISKCRGGCRATALINHIDHDPLMTRPLTEKLDASEEKVTLHEDMIPVKNFDIRDESFGYALVSENRIVPVSFEAGPVLDILNTAMTLKEIRNKYGERILEFIGNLYHLGLIDMQFPNSQLTRTK